MGMRDTTLTEDDTVVVAPAIVGHSRTMSRHDGWIDLVAFADTDRRESFEIQLVEIPDDQAVAHGAQGYCIASNTLAGAIYRDPIRGWTVERGTRVSFDLTDEAAEAFGARFWVYLVADRESLAQVTPEIERITGQAAAIR